MRLKKPIVSHVTNPVVEALEERRLMSAALTLVNPFGLPGSDRLIFNRILNLDPTFPNVVHDTNPLTLENTGDATLTLSGLTISGPWQFVGTAPDAGTTIAPGGSITVTLKFIQNGLPAHTSNETNYTTSPTGGAAIYGSLTIRSDDPVNPVKTVTLAGYWQNQSEHENEPNLLTITNLLAGYDTVIATPAQLQADSNGVDLEDNGPAPTYYGQEVIANSWVAANDSEPITMQKLETFQTEGVALNTYWYSTATMNAHLLMTTVPNQDQSLLPTLANGQPMIASFSPDGAFGFRDDDLYSDDAVNLANGDTRDDGHRFRFYPLIDENGNAVANTWLVAVDHGTFISDYQDASYIVTNMQPASAANTPPAPTNLTATNAVNPVLNWTGVSYSDLAGYNVYRGTSPTGPFTKLTPTPISATTFTDSFSPPNGVTLYYRVTAVDSVSGNESAPATTTANTPNGPVAGSFTVSTYTNQALPINILSHITDISGTPTPGSLLIVTSPANGTATIDATNGIITYTSNVGFTGTNTIVYSISDSNGATPSSGTITINVINPGLNAPIVSAQFATTLANTPVVLSPQAVDSSGATITPSAIEISNTTGGFTANPLPTTLTTAAGGTVTVNSNETVTYTPAANFVGGDSFLFKVKDANGNLSSQATFTINVGAEISSAKGANKSINYPDAAGQAVTVTLNKGVADVFFAGTGTESIKKGKVIAAGHNLTISNIAASNTTSASVLVIKTKHFNGAITVGGITDSAALGAIVAFSSKLIGNGNATTMVLGSVRSIFLKSISTATIRIGGSSAASLTLTSGAITDSSIASGETISLLKAPSWTNVSFAVDAESLSAPAIRNLSVAGEFDANLNLTSTGNDLGIAKIAGPLNIGFWNISGSAAAIIAGSVKNSWGMVVGGALKFFAVQSGGLPADITAGAIGALSVRGNLTDDVVASSSKLIAVTGSIDGAQIDIGGNLNSIVAASMVDSILDVGTSLTPDGVASASSTNIGVATLGNLILTSRAAGAFSNSSIVASHIGSASLGNVKTDNGGTPEGLAAVTFKSITAVFGGKPLRGGPAQLASLSALQAYLMTVGFSDTAFGDFQLDYVSAPAA